MKCLQPKPIYLLNPVRSSPEIRDALDSFQDEWFKLHNLTDPCRLYHYTTLDGLKGILQSRSLRFGHIRSFNDPSELQYGKRAIVAELNDAIAKEGSGDIKKLLTRLVMFVDSFERRYETYVACFCEIDNLLSQWRGYAASGVGYSIGISFDPDTKFSHDSDNLSKDSHIILRKIIYKPEIQTKTVTNCINKIIDGAKNAAEINQFDTWLDQAALESTNILFDIALSLKNEAFKEEKEWRLIKVMQANRKPELLKFRENLTPYIDTYIYKKVNDDALEFPMRTVRYGPMLEPASTEPSLRLFIHSNAAFENPIKISANGIRILGAGYVLRN